MPPHIRFLLRHAVFGALAAAVFCGLLLGFNIANLRHLILNTDGGLIGLVALWVLCTTTFSGVQIGIAVMGLGTRPRPPAPPSGKAEPAPAPIRKHGHLS